METNKESHFWTFLASLLNFEAPLWNWRKRLNDGFNFDSFQGKYLLPTDKTASLIMCPKNCDYSCGFRKVRENDDGSFHAVCHKKKKDSFPISDSEILFYKVNYNVLLPDVAQTLGIQPLSTPYQTWDEAWEIGTLRIGNQALPVFFTLRNWNHKVIDLILNLNRMCNKPYLLLVTSAKMISPTSQKALEDSGSLFIPLNDVLDFNEEAEVILTRSPDSYFENVPGLFPHVEVEAKVEPENFFQKCGDVWMVRFQGGQTFLLTGVETGAKYIHYLFGHPGQNTSVVEIVRKLSFADGQYSMDQISDSPNDLTGISLSDLPTNQSGSIADFTAIKQYQDEVKQLLHDLEKAKGAGDETTVRSLQADLAVLQKSLTEAVSPQGYEKKINDPLKSITNSFRNAIRRVIKKAFQYDKEFANHLKTSVQYGAFPVYKPSRKIDWQL